MPSPFLLFGSSGNPCKGVSLLLALLRNLHFGDVEQIAQLTAERRNLLNRVSKGFRNFRCGVNTLVLLEPFHQFAAKSLIFNLNLGRLRGTSAVPLVQLRNLFFGMSYDFLVDSAVDDSLEKFAISHSRFLSCLSAFVLVTTLFIYQRKFLSSFDVLIISQLLTFVKAFFRFSRNFLGGPPPSAVCPSLSEYIIPKIF